MMFVSQFSKVNAVRGGRSLFGPVSALVPGVLMLLALFLFTTNDARAGEKTIATIKVSGTSGGAAGTVTVTARAQDNSVLFTQVVNIPANTSIHDAYGLIKDALTGNANFGNNYAVYFKENNDNVRIGLRIKRKKGAKPKIESFDSQAGAAGFLPHTTTGQTYEWQTPSNLRSMAIPQTVPWQPGVPALVTITPKEPGELNFNVVTGIYLGDDIQVTAVNVLGPETIEFEMTALEPLPETEIAGVLMIDDDSIVGCFEVQTYEPTTPVLNANWGQIKALFR